LNEKALNALNQLGTLGIDDLAQKFDININTHSNPGNSNILSKFISLQTWNQSK
jgi:hypothetical protein